jgi:hypothetical protein
MWGWLAAALGGSSPHRILHSTRVGRCAVNIYRNAEYDEYIVKSVVGGRVQGGEDGGYFTADKQDARSTAAAEVRRLRRVPACR